MATFGNTNEEIGTDTICKAGVQYVCGSIFHVDEAGDATSITVGLSADIVMSEYSVKCEIYDVDGNFMAETEERTGLSFGVALKWETFNFSSPVHFVAGYYYLTVFAMGTRYPQYGLLIRLTPSQGIVTKEYTKTEAAYPDTPASIYEAFLYNRASIYCTYTPAPPVARAGLNIPQVLPIILDD